MAAAAAAAAGPAQPGDPPPVINTQQDREAWINLSTERYRQLCETAYHDGDFSYAKVMMQANVADMGAFMNDRTTQGNQIVTAQETFRMMAQVQKTNLLKFLAHLMIPQQNTF